jgi:hypothetical protein
VAKAQWTFPSARAYGVLDLVVIAYIVLWVVLGLLLGYDISRQAGLARQVERVGVSLRETGEAFASLSALPLVGDDIAEIADSVTASGAEVERSGIESRESISEMSWLVGAAVVLVPVLILLPVYVPMRLAWRREVATIRRALSAGDPAVARVLALRALGATPYDRLVEAEADPWRALQSGEVSRLAAVELERLGLSDAAGAAAVRGAAAPEVRRPQG